MVAEASPVASGDDDGSFVRRCPVWAAILLPVVLTGSLCGWNLGWGLPNTGPWHADSIAGLRLLDTWRDFPDHWQDRYPPLHFLITKAVYAPIVGHWLATGDMRWGDDGGRARFRQPATARLTRLIYLSRAITLLMAVGAAVGLSLTAGVLYSDSWTTLLAGLTLSLSAEFVFLGHLGTLDVPALCWLSWSLYFFARAWRKGRALDYALVGLLGAAAVCTKDPIGGAYVGVAAVLITRRVAEGSVDRGVWRRAVRVVVDPRVWLAFGAFAVPYLLLNGVPFNFTAFQERMAHWLSGVGISEWNREYRGQLWLAGRALLEGARAVGWPMLLLLCGAPLYLLVRGDRRAWLMIVPAAAYYLVVIVNIHYVFARFLLPMIACGAVLVGRAGAMVLRQALLADGPPRGATAAAVLVLAFATTAGYAIAVDLEMADDSRYRAEAWMDKNVRRDEYVGVWSWRQYLPRLKSLGYRGVRLDTMDEQLFAQPLPRYVVLSSLFFERYDDRKRECLHRLLRGDFGYRMAAVFRRVHLDPARPWYAAAGWGTGGAGVAGPEIVVMEAVDRPVLRASTSTAVDRPGDLTVGPTLRYAWPFGQVPTSKPVGEQGNGQTLRQHH